MANPFHEGERAVQQRAGVAEMAARIGNVDPRQRSRRGRASSSASSRSWCWRAVTPKGGSGPRWSPASRAFSTHRTNARWRSPRRRRPAIRWRRRSPSARRSARWSSIRRRGDGCGSTASSPPPARRCDSRSASASPTAPSTSSSASCGRPDRRAARAMQRSADARARPAGAHRPRRHVLHRLAAPARRARCVAPGRQSRVHRRHRRRPPRLARLHRQRDVPDPRQPDQRAAGRPAVHRLRQRRRAAAHRPRPGRLRPAACPALRRRRTGRRLRHRRGARHARIVPLRAGQPAYSPYNP